MQEPTQLGQAGTRSEFANALRLALASGAGAAAAVGVAAPAMAADTNADDAEEVIITGTRIRRVDTETASPLTTISAEAIAETGAATMGEILTALPEIAGAATNPSVNNGGGDGDTNVELRGLSVERTLVLLNGRRVGLLGWETGAVDVNSLPINLIERVEVLKEGAGAIYGSDAIGGVVNFITKQSVDGFNVGTSYGQSSRSDGENSSLHATWGSNSDRGSTIFTANYNRQKQVSANDRDFSRFAIYLYSGSVFPGGSSRTPSGRITLPAAFNTTYGYGCGVSAGTIAVTRRAGTTGASPADYRCYSSATDSYNYQPLNLIMTPQERVGLFSASNYQLTDNVDFYSEFMFNRTESGFKIAPLPFDATSDDTVVSATSIYNPFGINLGGLGSGFPNSRWRLEALGQRQNSVETNSYQAVAGLRGTFGSSSWQWDANATYARQDRDRAYQGYLYGQALKNAVGPSFIDGGGTARCGTPTAIISGCTPVNIFNLADTSQVAALEAVAASYGEASRFRTTLMSFNANGDLAMLPAGTMKGALGVEYASKDAQYQIDFVSEAVAPLYQTCLISSETCGASTEGDDGSVDFYGELFVPLLADRPGVQALNLSAGVRSSDYDSVGRNTSGTVKLEYRPVGDVLLRASYAQVFRAPTLLNQFRGPTKDAPTFTDPCIGLTAAQVADTSTYYELACVNVIPDGTFEQANAQVDGLRLGNSNLDPEDGDVLTYGVVYESTALQGLSATVDFWKYKIDDFITLVDPTFAADQCVATGLASWCNLFSRDIGANAGQILVVQEPYLNLGQIKTDGYDLGLRYETQPTSAGSFRFSLDASHVDSYFYSQGNEEFAGTYSNQFGNYARWRGTFGLGWSMGDFTARLATRYIDAIVVHDPDGAPGVQPDLAVPSQSYTDLSFGYTWRENTKLQLGINNAFDKQPPIMYQNNVINANTDVSTYDTVGRRYWLGVTHSL